MQTETATVGKLVEGTQLQYLGLNGRNPVFLAGLMPGVNTDLAGNDYSSDIVSTMNGSNLGIPWSQSHNLSPSKDFRIRETQRVTFLMEAVNWLNHPDLGSPNTDWRSSNFGMITSKSSNTREMQVSLRFSF